MATTPRIREGLTLDEFLAMPNIDVRPYLEYVDGRAVPKMSPQKQHGGLTRFFLDRLNDFAEPTELGEAFPELRCTFAGRSIIPDVVFLLEEHIEVEPDGKPSNATPIPPDIHIEVISPDQSPKEADEKLRFSTSNGCPLGLRVDPYRETIDVYRPGQEPRLLPPDGVLEGDPVLPGFRLPAAAAFEWLKRRRRRRRASDGQEGPA